MLRGLGGRRVGEGWADLCCVLDCVHRRSQLLAPTSSVADWCGLLADHELCAACSFAGRNGEPTRRRPRCNAAPFAADSCTTVSAASITTTGRCRDDGRSCDGADTAAAV